MLPQASLVFVHGGVSKEPRPSTSLAHALPRELESKTALDAVESAVRALEDDPALNAGWGSVLTREGTLELDAGIADGATRRAGGVLCVTVRHPISLARLVMEKTPHVLVASEGAMALAGDMERLTDTTSEQRERWEEAGRRGDPLEERYGTFEPADTVGAVALDDRGRLAAGSSTGGVFGKLPGRVGDSPIFGAGTYASEGAAVVGTGLGELFLETLAALRTGELIEGGEHPQRACEQIIGSLRGISKAHAGLLALDGAGRSGAAFRGGSWAVAGPDGPIEAVQMDRGGT